MTICIASMAGNDTVIMAADKMVSVNLPNIKFERKASKIIPISSCCALATAGDALIHTEILRRISEHKDSDNLHHLAHAIKNAYVDERERLVEELVLRPVGLSRQDVTERQQNLKPEILVNVYQQMSQFRFDFVVLLAGVDARGPHIYTVSPPGHLRCMDSIGYWAIGSGEHHALQTFITSEFEGTISFNRALLVTYEAKKRSEKATGVGELSDILVIKNGKTSVLGDDDISKLEKVYSERLEDERKWLKRTEELDLGIKIQ